MMMMMLKKQAFVICKVSNYNELRRVIKCNKRRVMKEDGSGYFNVEYWHIV